jgi:hypothetical protein
VASDLNDRTKQALEREPRDTAEMSGLLTEWLAQGWCAIDGAPAIICGGPHVHVRYSGGKADEIVLIESRQHAGEMFPDLSWEIVELPS